MYTTKIISTEDGRVKIVKEANSNPYLSISVEGSLEPIIWNDPYDLNELYEEFSVGALSTFTTKLIYQLNNPDSVQLSEIAIMLSKCFNEGWFSFNDTIDDWENLEL